MNIKVKDLMVKSVITTMPHKTIGHAQSIMTKNKIKSVPVIDDKMEIKGIITATDLLDDFSEATPISKVMTTKVYTIPAGYSPYLNGYTKEKYILHLESILKGNTLIETKNNLDTNNQNISDSSNNSIKNSNKHTVLLEILPHQQKTRIDFYCTEKYVNIPTVCITEIFTEGTHLYYEREGNKIKIDRIYNRIILDELKHQTKEIQEKGALLESNLDIGEIENFLEKNKNNKENNSRKQLKKKRIQIEL